MKRKQLLALGIAGMLTVGISPTGIYADSTGLDTESVYAAQDFDAQAASAEDVQALTDEIAAEIDLSTEDVSSSDGFASDTDGAADNTGASDNTDISDDIQPGNTQDSQLTEVPTVTETPIATETLIPAETTAPTENPTVTEIPVSAETESLQPSVTPEASATVTPVETAGNEAASVQELKERLQAALDSENEADKTLTIDLTAAQIEVGETISIPSGLQVTLKSTADNGTIFKRSAGFGGSLFSIAGSLTLESTEKKITLDGAFADAAQAPSETAALIKTEQADAVLTINGAALVNNAANSGNGGAIDNSAAGAVTLNSAYITGNTSALGSAVYTAGDLTISGEIVVKDNKDSSGAESNIYLGGQSMLLLAGDGLTGEAYVSVRADDEKTTRVIARASEGSSAVIDNFINASLVYEYQHYMLIAPQENGQSLGQARLSLRLENEGVSRVAYNQVDVALRTYECTGGQFHWLIEDGDSTQYSESNPPSADAFPTANVLDITDDLIEQSFTGLDAVNVNIWVYVTDAQGNTSEMAKIQPSRRLYLEEQENSPIRTSLRYVKLNMQTNQAAQGASYYYKYMDASEEIPEDISAFMASFTKGDETVSGNSFQVILDDSKEKKMTSAITCFVYLEQTDPQDSSKKIYSDVIQCDPMAWPYIYSKTIQAERISEKNVQFSMETLNADGYEVVIQYEYADGKKSTPQTVGKVENGKFTGTVAVSGFTKEISGFNVFIRLPEPIEDSTRYSTGYKVKYDDWTETPTPTTDPSATATPTPTVDPSVTATITPTLDPAATVTPTLTPTVTQAPLVTPTDPGVNASTIVGMADSYVQGEKVTFGVYGAGMDNTDPNTGDIRYYPYRWKAHTSEQTVEQVLSWRDSQGNVQGTFRQSSNGAFYGQTAKTTNITPGSYPLTIVFMIQEFDGVQWVETNQYAKLVKYFTITANVNVEPTRIPGSYYTENGVGYEILDDGTIVTVAPSQTSDNDGTAQQKDSVSTGDETPIAYLISLLAASLAAGGYTIVRKKKREEE
ncbi:MAG: hypothetical protein Q4E89_02490 [Eubacteriales bacterium]|nr:hypothetical protein [Eubacteriales bacterium]